MSLAKLGEAVGGSSPTAVSIALNRLQARLATDKKLAAALAEAKKFLTNAIKC